MPKITFQVPNGFDKGNPANPENYVGGQANLKAVKKLLKQPGVYIWGIKDKKGKFFPLYIGIRKDIWSRIPQHYNGNAYMGASTSGLFDLNQLLANPFNFYTTTLLNFNLFWVNVNHTVANMVFMLNPPINLKDSLVYFRSSRAMNRHCTLPDITYPIHNFTHQDAFNEYNFLNGIGLTCLGGLANRMLNTKNIIRDNFYFVYAPFDGPNGIINSLLNDPQHPLNNKAVEFQAKGIYNVGRANGPGKDIAERVETATKKALEKINLYTIGEAPGALYPFEIDLTAIQNNLINVGGYVYPDNYGKAGDPSLEIPVPNYPPYY